jgi:6-pyruvoyltetrahydropterin/6-carboxytetrahydropterin synthase
MIRLSRQVRFAISAATNGQESPAAANGFGGSPALTGLGHYFALDVSLLGPVEPESQYLINIKRVDERVRELAVPLIEQAVRGGRFGGGGRLLLDLRRDLEAAWPGRVLDELRLWLSPHLSLATLLMEHPMIRLSQRFEFCASHRLHNPALDDAENRRVFGKCNNAQGHGHNYELQVTICGEPDANGLLMEVPAFERVVTDTVIDRFDHRNLNVEVPEFANRLPSVENIARVCYELLAPALRRGPARLASVTVWETPRTWCEYGADSPSPAATPPVR